MRLFLIFMLFFGLSAQASLYDSIESVDTLRVLADANYKQQNNKGKDNQRKIATDEETKKAAESQKEESN